MTLPTPRVRIRTNLPAPTPPASPTPRVRVRTVNPPDLPRRPDPAPASVHDTISQVALCSMGDITPSIPADRWHGWPNGSAVMGKMGSRIWHKGRHIPITGGGFHVIRWNAIKLRYEYVRKVRTHAEAMNAL